MGDVDQEMAGTIRADRGEYAERQLGAHTQTDRGDSLERSGAHDLPERTEACHVDKVPAADGEPTCDRGEDGDAQLRAAAHRDDPAGRILDDLGDIFDPVAGLRSLAKADHKPAEPAMPPRRH